MPFGPFDSYAPPGVYTRSQVQQDASGPPTGNRIPILIGVGQETLSQEDFELVRGSSSSVDQRIVNEDVDDRFILDFTNPNNPLLGAKTGNEARFRVQNYPIVTGGGQGLVTNDTNDITVTVDGDLVSPAAVDGEEGIVTLQVAPEAGAEVRITYFFNREDTQTTDDVSEQVSDDTAILYSSSPENYTIDTDVNDEFNLLVNGTEFNVVLPDGPNVSASDIAAGINSTVGTSVASADIDNQGQTRLQLTAQGSLEILAGTANTELGFVAGQSTSRRTTFYTYNGPIVTGDDGGITTTDIDDVTVTVDGTEVTVTEVDGGNRAVTLEQAPQVGSTVEITYFYNTFQNTFDHLPNTGIDSVQRVGVSPGRVDFIEGNDYVIDENGRILWGSAVTIEPGEHTAGTDFYDDSQITTSLVDDRIFFEEVDRLVDNTLTPPRESDTTVVLGNVPTEGDGRDTPTTNPDKVLIYHGPDLTSAEAAGPVDVIRVDSSNRRVTVQDPIPPSHTVYATYWYSRLNDDTYTLTRTLSGRTTVFSSLRGENLYNVKFGTSGATDTIEWPSGVESEPDALIVGSDGVNEEVTITFTTVGSDPATFTNTESGPYDLFASASDTYEFNLADGATSASVTGSLNQAAFAVLVGGALPVGATYSLTSTFEFQIDGTSYSADMSTASGTSLVDQAEVIWRLAPNETEIKGSATEDFDLNQTGSGVAYDVDINGTNVTNTYTGGATDDAATAAAALESDIVTASGTLTAGDVSVPGNDFQVIANTDGTVSIVASESLSVNDGGGGAGADLEDVLGWDGGTQANVDGTPSYTEGTTLENTKIARIWSGTDAEYMILRSRTTPSVPSDVSTVRVLDGSANDDLGFESFSDASGAVSAVNKGATLLSDPISATDVTNLESDQFDFVISVDGVEYTVVGSSFSGITNVGDIQTQIDSVIGGGGAGVATVTVEDSDRIRITSDSADATSSLLVGDGLANQYIGFNEGDTAGQRKATADEIVAVLNNDSSGWADNSAGSVELSTATGTLDSFFDFAYAESTFVSGAGDFLTFTTWEFGSDTSIVFTGASSTTWLNDTGLGIDTGDSVNGNDGQDGFNVTSTNANGSAGSGLVGQTYTDDTTGLRFTVQESTDGDYADGETFTLIVEEQQEVGASLVNRAIPGVELTITSLSAVGVNDTAIVTTYDKSGEEPGIGDFYYITYRYEKTDFSTQLYTQFRDIQSNFGELSAENPLTLASYLAILNGAVVVGIKQVEKQEGFGQASSQAFINALDELKRPLQGGNTPDLLVPLTTDPDVMGSYVQHSEIQSSQRFRQERRCIFGVASGTRPQDAADIAQGLDSERAILVYPDSAIVTLTNELGGEENFIVDGTYIAAALAGALVNPQFDVAQPMTRRRITGFRRLNRTLDEIEKNQLAVAGVTVMEDRGTSLQVRDGLTTNVATRFTSTPSIIAIQDFVQQQARAALDRFIGLKFLTGRAQDVELALSGLLNALVEQEIIVDFRGVRAEPDPNDPTVLRVSAFYAPVFPLKYIPITYTIGSANSL